MYLVDQSTQFSRLTRIIAVGLLAAALLNGAGFFLKRIGVLDQDAYQAYLRDYCDPQSTARWLGNRCSQWRRSPEDPERLERYDPRHLYTAPGAQRGLKLAKDLFLALFVGGSLILLRPRFADRAAVSRRFERWRPCVPWPAVPLLTSLAVGLVIAWTQFGPGLAAAGLRSFWFLAVALVGGWIASRESMSRLADAVALLLLIQIPIVAIETWYGLPLDKGYDVTADWNLPSRMSGSFIMPNSLGLAAVLGLAFYWSFSTHRRLWWPLLLVVVILLLLSRSAGGFVVLGVLAASLSLFQADRTKRVRLLLLWAALGSVFAWVLPYLLMRGSLVESALGRLDKLAWLMSTGDTWQQWLGHGLGSGTNSWLNLLTTRLQTDPTPAVGASQPLALTADSTLTLLFAQVGWLGVAGFYGLLAWWLWADRTGRCFCLSVLVGSLVINVTELFPVNFLLGLALSRALYLTGQRSSYPCRPRRPSAMRRT